MLSARLSRPVNALALMMAAVLCLLPVAGMAQPVPGEVLVKFRSQARGPILQGQPGPTRLPAGARVIRSLALPGWQRIQLPAQMPMAEGIRWFRSHPDVLHVEQNYRYSLHARPNDPQEGHLYGLDRISAPAAWDISTGSTNVIVAVMDTGIDTTHPDLAPNLWRNSREIAGNGIDDDQNDLIDDVLGADFVDHDGDPQDDSGHGTHVAGTIGAAGNNGRGGVGVCWQVRLLALRVGKADGFGTTAEIVAAFNYAVRLRQRGENLRIINCSWGGGFPSVALKEAMCAAGAAGLIMVCSAGNDTDDTDIFPNYPSGYDCPEIISVAASTSCDDPASYSNFGRISVDLAAPGSGILSTYRGGERYGLLSGTSMASPHVSGAAALLLSVRPDLTAAQLRSVLLSTVDPLPAWSNKVTTGGRLNLARALEKTIAGEFGSPPLATNRSTRLSAIRHSPSGPWGNDSSGDPGISADGRWVVFNSFATNLVANDMEGYQDVFLLDRNTGAIVRVSQTAAGAGARGDSDSAVISADGRFVVFVSPAANLAIGDSNGVTDVFLWNRETRTLELISIRANGRAGNRASELPSISADGQIVAFASDATDLIGTDTNLARDVFVRDRTRGVTERVSVRTGGAQANDWSDAPSISGDGRFVAFHSRANNLSSIDGDTVWDVFLRDRTAARTDLISVTSDGQGAGDGDSIYPVLSGNGRFVLFHSAADNLDGRTPDPWLAVFLRDRETGQIIRVSDPEGRGATSDSYADGISSDGRICTFTSDDPALAPGGAPALFRAFLYDRLSGAMGPIALNDAGYAPIDNAFLARPSGDGRFVVFTSYGFNLVPDDGNGAGDAFILDRGLARPDLGVRPMGAAASWDGLGIIHPEYPQRAWLSITDGGTATYEVLLVNGGEPQAYQLRIGSAIPSGWSIRITHDSSDVTAAVLGTGWQTASLPAGSNLLLRIEARHTPNTAATPRFAPRLVATGTSAAEEVDAVTLAAEVPPVAPGLLLASRGPNGEPAERHAEVASVSEAGKFVAFSSEANNLDSRRDTNFQSDIFLFDRGSRITRRISDASSLHQANADSRYPALSADGKRVAFQSLADNLVALDSNDVEDVFVRDIESRVTSRASASSNGTAASRGSDTAAQSGNGRYVGFTSIATNIVSGDNNNARDVFIRDLQTGMVECASRSSQGAFGDADSEHVILSADGRFALFQSYASNLGPTDTNGFSDLYLLDRTTHTLELITRNTNGVAANGPSAAGSMSDDGRWIAFFSDATDIVPGATPPDSATYLLDRQSGRIQTLDEITPELPGGLLPRRALISPSGKRLAIAAVSDCGSATPAQVFVLDRESGIAHPVSTAPSGDRGTANSFISGFSPDGRYLAIESYASNLIGEHPRQAGQVLLADLGHPALDLLVRREPGNTWRAGATDDADPPVITTVVSNGGGTEQMAVQVINTGSDADEFIVHAILFPGGTAFTAAAVVTDPPDIHAALFSDTGWKTPLLPPSQKVEIRFGVPALPASDSRSQIQVRVRSASDRARSHQAMLILLPDSDGDHLPDEWEREWFPSLATANAMSDSDLDGISDQDEWQAGTGPTDPQSKLTVSATYLPGNKALEIRWPGVPNRFYTVERSSDPAGSFEPVSAGPLAGIPGNMSWTDAVGGSRSTAFYRIRADRP